MVVDRPIVHDGGPLGTLVLQSVASRDFGCKAAAMTPDVRALGNAYRKAADGDVDKALELVIAELLDARAEADFRAQALDQWVSRGYVQGTASELCRQQAERFRQTGADAPNLNEAPARTGV